MKKKWIILPYSLVILGALGLLVYDYLNKGSLDKGNLTRSLLIVAGAVAGMAKTLTGRKKTFGASNHSLYEKAIRMMAALGNNGADTKEFIRSLNPPFEI